MERVADPADHATGIEMEHVEDKVAAVRRLVPRPEEMLKLHDECTSCDFRACRLSASHSISKIYGLP